MPRNVGERGVRLGDKTSTVGVLEIEKPADDQSMARRDVLVPVEMRTMRVVVSSAVLRNVVVLLMLLWLGNRA